MSKIRVIHLVVGFFGGLVFMPSSVEAGGNSSFNTDYTSGWEEWEPFGTTAIADPPTARIRGWIERPCLEPNDPSREEGLGASGDEFNFSFILDTRNSCVEPGFNRQSRIAAFDWQSLDSSQDSVDFSCLDVRGSVESSVDDEVEIRISQESMIYAVNGNAQSSGRERFFDTDVVHFEVWAPLSVADAVSSEATGLDATVNGDPYEITISIRPCSFDFDGPDIEHYRRMAEQATALPDTL